MEKKETSYEERQAKILAVKQELFAEFQLKLKDEKLNLYGFKIHIVDGGKSSKFNTDRGFFTSAYLYFKEINFGHIMPVFNEAHKAPTKITNLHLSRGSNDLLGTINYFRQETNLKLLEFKNEHDTLQSCIDEVEKLRQEAVKFYSI